MTSRAVIAPRILLTPSVPLEAADDRWARWIAKGRAHDRARRERLLDGLALAGALLLLGIAIIVGLG